MPRKKRSFGHRLQERRASAPAVLCVSNNRPSRRKRQREEEQKRKAEERERKSKERAKKVKQAVEKANTSAPADENEAGPSCLKEPSTKKPRRDALPSSTDSEIDFNVCCMCFGTYSEDVANGDGRNWIECTCGRWLHEDCAEDCLLNKDGKEMFCHSCIWCALCFFALLYVLGRLCTSAELLNIYNTMNLVPFWSSWCCTCRDMSYNNANTKLFTREGKGRRSTIIGMRILYAER